MTSFRQIIQLLNMHHNRICVLPYLRLTPGGWGPRLQIRIARQGPPSWSPVEDYPMLAFKMRH